MIKVLCHGKFDVLHSGHLWHLHAAKKIGDYLIVSITAAKFCKNNLYFTDEERKKSLELIDWIDEVYICNSENAIEAINKYKPDIYVKGYDYEFVTDTVLNMECDIVTKYGGETLFTDDTITFSSTKLKAYKHKNHNKD